MLKDIAKKFLTGLGVLLLLALGYIALATYASRPASPPPASATQDNPALAGQAQSVLKGNAAIHDVRATTDGAVYVTLTITKADIGSDVKAEDTGRSLAELVMKSVPAVTNVTVFDGNRSMIDTWDRK